MYIYFPPPQSSTPLAALLYRETTMVSSRSGYGITENPSNPNAQERNEDGQRRKITEYEQSREERIRENVERMQKLGILDLSLKVKALKPTPKTRKTPCARSSTPCSSPLPPPGPVRRSSRLQNVTPISYSEAYLTKKDKPLASEKDLLREDGSKPEVYTEEHEKLLGSTEMSWTLFVDGVGEDGKRIYDPVKGKTCHQCRQKTLGHRTYCSKCNLVQGQFCGDCLYMRYGENVIEANQNLNWICPVCRGICNCSLCRQAKGWAPTGPLYRKISSLGYRSVAHYLIQTRRLKTETEPDSNSKVPASAKRSLPFMHVEETSEEMVLMDTNPQLSENPESEVLNPENLPCDKQEEKTHLFDNEDGDFKQKGKTHFSDKEHYDCKQEAKQHLLDNELGDYCKLDMEMKIMSPTELHAENSLQFGPGGKETDILVDKKYDCSNVSGDKNVIIDQASDCSNVSGDENVNLNKAAVLISSHDQIGSSSQSELKINEGNNGFSGSKEEDKISYQTNSEIDCILAPESSPKPNQKCIRTVEPTGDSIAGRLRPRRNRDNKQEEHGLTGLENGTLGVKQDLNVILPQHSAEADLNISNSSCQATMAENIAGRLRKRCAGGGNEQEINKFSSSAKAKTAIDISSPLAAISEPSPDNIAARLRQRRRRAGGI